MYHETVYEKNNRKTEMNQNGHVASSIEQNLLYKMHRLVFPPTSVWGRKTVKNNFYHIFSANSDKFFSKKSGDHLNNSVLLLEFVELVMLIILIVNLLKFDSIFVQIRVKYY